LKGARVQHVNSTAVGGGVAEILARLVPLMRDVGLDATWDVLQASEPFFQVTKALHNALHGQPVALTFEMQKTFVEGARENRDLIRADADFVILHDPQPLPLVEAREAHPGRFIWRCHIDLSHAEPEALGVLRPYVLRADASVFHLPEFVPSFAPEPFIIPPAIDPLSEKNRELAPAQVTQILSGLGVSRGRPLLVQISRFDRLKDPLGVLRAFQMVKRWHDVELVLAGGSAADDPEGQVVLAEVRAGAGPDPDVHILDLPPNADREVNALQRATVAVQKSLREGFGLVVTEALWKGKPVVGGAVGGIRRQVIPEINGHLVHSIEGAAFRIHQLLSDPKRARAMGEAGRELVRENFLLPHYLKRWLLVLLSLRRAGEAGPIQL
jgi:trehalose synthase